MIQRDTPYGAFNFQVDLGNGVAGGFSDVSGLVTEMDWPHQPAPSPLDVENALWCFDEALEAFGPQRLMFGSDWPVCLLATSYARAAAIVESWSAKLTRDEREWLWYRSAQRAYSLA